MSTERKPRAPALLYTALSVAILIAVAAVALSARQPPPPTIAEFAPQATQEITKADLSQTGRSGIGANGECTGSSPCAPGTGNGGGGGGEVASPGGGPRVARVRRCIGDPPRQI